MTSIPLEVRHSASSLPMMRSVCRSVIHLGACPRHDRIAYRPGRRTSAMPTKVVETECGPVEYAEAGAGDPILYFHGTGVTGDVMLAVETSLIEDGFRLVVPNRPGYGKTPLSPHHSAAACADVTAALLDTLGVANLSVMGSSGGAAFAASFALRHPNRTRSLVL